MQLALVVGVVAAVGVGLRRFISRTPSSGIDVGAVSDRWVAENRAERHDGFH
jgi:hypothetical protein